MIDRSIYWSSELGHPTALECINEAQLPARLRHTNGSGTPPFIAVSHHKSGTVAAFNLFFATCCRAASNITNAADFWTHWWGGDLGRTSCTEDCSQQLAFFAPNGIHKVILDRPFPDRSVAPNGDVVAKVPYETGCLLYTSPSPRDS